MSMMSSALSITQTGTTVTTGAASANVAIPNTAGGVPPKYIRIAASAESYVRVGGATVAATANDILVQPADSIILATFGLTHVAYIQGTGPARVNIIPVENL